MNKIFGLALFSFALIPAIAQQPVTKNGKFLIEEQARFEQVYKTYKTLVDSDVWKDLLGSGEIFSAHEKAENLVPDASKTALDYYILGNFYYTLDPEKSFAFMRKAELMEPENPLILFERAMHEHRNRSYTSAISYYERFAEFEYEGMRPKLYAYLTHALLMTGKAEDALLSWSKADFGSHHISIEKAMYSLFSTTNQHYERTILINSLRAKESGAVCDLLSLDKEWETDWWNVNPNNEHLQHDHALIGSLSRNSQVFEKELAVCPLLGAGSAADLLDSLEKHFGKTDLPDSPRAVYRILFELSNAGLISVPEIIERYSDTIESLAKRKNDDLKSRELLGFLYSSTGDQKALEKVDYLTAKKFHARKFAESYFLASTSQILVRPTFFMDLILLAEKYHDSPDLQAMMMAFVEGTEYEKRYLARLVAAQFHNVHVYSRYRLKDYMSSLWHELDKRDLLDPDFQYPPSSSLN